MIEILGEQIIRKASALSIPAKEDLGITSESEVAYNRIVKFLRLHEPTGHERDVAHKYDVVRFLSVKQMLHECQEAKLPQIQAACLKKVVQWFDESSPCMNSSVGNSASTPVLPPRMSPKKCTSTERTMVKSSSEDTLSTGPVDVTMKAAVAHKLEKYKMPDLRASHIRRVAQLRSRGADVPEEALDITDDIDPEDGEAYVDEVLDPSEYEKRDQRERVKATFKAYEPETDAEFAMNQVWLDRKREENLERDKAQEVRGKLLSWSLKKSRDESEYLRKREAMQLAAGLDKLVETQFEAINQPHRRLLEKKKQEWQALQQAVPTSIAERPDQSLQDGEEGASTPVRASTAGTFSTTKKKKSNASGMGTSTASGGMHYRNQLPANYTPQSKRSGTPTSFSSGDTGSTPNTPLSTSSSGKLRLLDEAAARAESRGLGHINLSDSPASSDDSPVVHNEDDDRVEVVFQSSTLPFSERVHEKQPELKFQPFHTPSELHHGSLPLSRAVSTSLLNRKLYPRGTIPPQTEPIDPEYRHLYTATQSRKPPVPPSILPDKPFVGHGRNHTTPKHSSTTNNQREAARASIATAGVQVLPKSTLQSSSSSHFVSAFRAEQMHEVDRIRILFEQHKLAVPMAVVERGLLVSEDRSTVHCVQNLPLPGARLIANPLQVRVKAKVSKKKKKKKKSGKGSPKKTKSKKSAGDRSKSPTKKKTK